MGDNKKNTDKITYPYRHIVFRDVNNDDKFLIRSTIETNDKTKTIKWKDGQTYPLIDVSISATSHPWYVGKNASKKTIDEVAQFNAKFYAPSKK